MPTLLYSTGPLLSPSPRRPPPMHLSYPAPPTPPHDSYRGTVISTFSPRSPSPPSHPTTGSNVLMGRSSYHSFLATQSRVVRIFNLPKDPSNHLAALFPAHNAPLTLWTLREEYGGPPAGDEDSVWAVFKSHSQAAAALALSGASVSIATALEADLEPFQKLRKLELRRHSHPSLGPTSPVARLSTPLRPSQSASDLRARALDLGSATDYAFTLSSNPPNPRNTFRQGDWICSSVNCAAHNFMRNVVCIGCGTPRPAPGPGPSPTAPLSLPWPRIASSPRFAGPLEYITSPVRESPPEPAPAPAPAPPRSLLKMPSLPSFSSGRTPTPTPPAFSPTAPAFAPMPPSPHSPSGSPTSLAAAAAAAAVALKLPSLLTPSGRAFSHGGKVQNVSSDPLAPCVLYWPDNEPRPSQRQIRPPGPGHAAPILNTGNKGPIEQQPGDWVCGVCDYLNWRRRKVCQTCYPYAEGNTDGVSAAVQAERIAMLAQVLAAHPQPPGPGPAPHPHAHTIPTPPHDARPLPPLRLATPPRTPEYVPWSLSFLHDDGADADAETPPLSASPSPQSAAPLVPLGSSIWALRKDEV